MVFRIALALLKVEMRLSHYFTTMLFSISHSTTFAFLAHILFFSYSQLTQKDLLALDFEGILNYFRVSLPRKISTEDECRLLFDTAYSFKVP